MVDQPRRVFFDTNIYIIGAAMAHSVEAQILRWAGYGAYEPGAAEVAVSEALFDQIVRVARRLRNKDWGSEILARIWQQLNVHYVLIDQEEIDQLMLVGTVPVEDIEIYLAARNGEVDCFVSANHKLIQALAAQTGDFACLTPAEFVEKYLEVQG